MAIMSGRCQSLIQIRHVRVQTIGRQDSLTDLRYKADLTDADWAVAGPLILASTTCSRPHF